MRAFDRERVARGFDRLAPVYDAAGALAFGGALRGSAAALLGEAPRDGRALVVGAGTGAVLVDLRRAGHRGAIVALDLSPAMTRRAAARLRAACGAAAGPARFVLGGIPLAGSAAEGDPALRGPFDLVLTPYVLDVLDPAHLRVAAAELAARLSRAVAGSSRTSRRRAGWRDGSPSPRSTRSSARRARSPRARFRRSATRSRRRGWCASGG